MAGSWNFPLGSPAFFPHLPMDVDGWGHCGSHVLMAEHPTDLASESWSGSGESPTVTDSTLGDWKIKSSWFRTCRLSGTARPLTPVSLVVAGWGLEGRDFTGVWSGCLGRSLWEPPCGVEAHVPPCASSRGLLTRTASPFYCECVHLLVCFKNGFPVMSMNWVQHEGPLCVLGSPSSNRFYVLPESIC